MKLKLAWKRRHPVTVTGRKKLDEPKVIALTEVAMDLLLALIFYRALIRRGHADNASYKLGYDVGFDVASQIDPDSDGHGPLNGGKRKVPGHRRLRDLLLI